VRIGGINAEVGVEARLPNREPDSTLQWKTSERVRPRIVISGCLLVQLHTWL